jgi:hypothetical protein
MAGELQITRTVAELRLAYGESAWLEASLRATKAMEAGDSTGFSFWRRIATLIEKPSEPDL